MKHALLYLALTFGLAVAVPAAMAADNADSKPDAAKTAKKDKKSKKDAAQEKAASEEQATNVVGEALKGVTMYYVLCTILRLGAPDGAEIVTPTHSL